MKDDIAQISRMLRSGKLSQEQAAELIDALAAADTTEPGAGRDSADPGVDEATVDPRYDPDGSSGSSRRRGRRGRRRAQSGWMDGDLGLGDLTGMGWSGARRDRDRPRRDGESAGDWGDQVWQNTMGGLSDELRATVEAAFKVGRSAISDAMREVGRDLRGTLTKESWLSDANTATASSTEAPTGADFEVAGNTLTAARIANLELHQSQFTNNTIRASAVTNVALYETSFDDLVFNGASLAKVDARGSSLNGCQFNGVAVSDLALGDSQFSESKFNGGYLRDIDVTESMIENLRLNGARIRDWQVKSSAMDDVKLNGVSMKSTLFSGAQINKLRMRAQRVERFTVKDSGLDNVRFYFDDWEELAQRPEQAGQLTGLTISDSVLTGCTFVNCVFDETTVRNCMVSNLRFEGVDFSGKTFGDAEALSLLATGPESNEKKRSGTDADDPDPSDVL